MAKLAVGYQNGTAVELYYEDHGTGDPVVLIHGWPLSSRIFERQVPGLVDAGHRVIAYDRRGFGSSSQPWDGYDYDTFTADLHALLEHLDVRDATLVGFSMGGGEVARYIATHGTDRVAKAVLAAAATPYGYKSDDNPEGGVDDALIAQMQDGVRSDRLAFLENLVRAWFGAGGQPDLISDAQRSYLLRIAAFASPKGTLDCIAAIARTDFRADLEKVTVPTLVIHGGSDALVPFEVSAKRTHEAIAGSELVVIDGAPHGLVLTHAEPFNRALLDFLDATNRFGEVELGIGRLRELTELDLDALQSLLERGSDLFVLTEDRRPSATEARELWDALPSATPRSHKHVIGLFGPDLVGVAEVVRGWPNPRTWNIGFLLLDPAFRRRRAGTQTVSAIDAWAARSGATRLRVSVLAVNTAALDFWQALGFTSVQARPTSVRAHATAVALERPVRGRR